MISHHGDNIVKDDTPSTIMLIVSFSIKMFIKSFGRKHDGTLKFSQFKRVFKNLSNIIAVRSFLPYKIISLLNAVLGRKFRSIISYYTHTRARV